jgi:hypothetical protein
VLSLTPIDITVTRIVGSTVATGAFLGVRKTVLNTQAKISPAIMAKVTAKTVLALIAARRASVERLKV